MWRNRFLGGVSFLPLMAPDDGAGGGAGGAGAGGDAGAAAAAAAAAAAGTGDKGAGDKGAGGTPADKTLAGGADAGAAAAAAAAAAGNKFPDKWREELAGDDKTALTDLAKYTDPRALYKSLRELQAKISKGELKTAPAPLAKDASDEQKAQWRKDNGLPETPQAYVDKLALPDGVVIGEADKPLINEFAKDLHAAGATQDEMNRAITSYYRLEGMIEAQRADADKEYQMSTEVALRSEWGADFKPNMNAFGALKAMMPAEVQTAIFAARTHDGRMLGNTPELLKWGAELARQLNPAATLISPNVQDGPKAMADEIAQIDAVRDKALAGDREAHRQYYGYDGKPGLDARQRELIAAEQQMKARGRAA